MILAKKYKILHAAFTLRLLSGLLLSRSRLTRTSSLSFLEIHEFCGFPVFSLLFWHEKLLLCRISRLQVDLKKDN